MSDATGIARLALLADGERMNSFSQNAANAQTIGYKRQVPFSVEFDASVPPTSTMAYGESGTAFNLSDNTPGALKSTARSLDVALAPNAYLVIDSVDGLRYSRRGDLRLDNQGRLVTEAGDAVRGVSGDLRLTSDQVTIAQDGEVRLNDEVIGQLQIARFDATAQFQYLGNGLMKTTAATLPVEKDALVVRQGFLEASNVKPLQDMLGVMETSRHFDLVKNGLTAYDSMLDDAINRLGTS